MIARLQTLLAKLTEEKPQNHAPLSCTELQLATAALLIEVATIDQHFADTELAALQQQLPIQFALSKDEVDSLIENARHAAKESASLYQFTKLINRQCGDQEKYILVHSLWKIAYADSNLDKYEEHIIRRIADLIHLRHSDFIRAKHQARDN